MNDQWLVRTGRGWERIGGWHMGVVSLLCLVSMGCGATREPIPVLDASDSRHHVSPTVYPHHSTASVQPLASVRKLPSPTHKPTRHARQSFPSSRHRAQDSKQASRRFSFRVQNMRFVDALALFAKANDLNIVASPEVTGVVTVDFHGLSLAKAMAALLEIHGYYWEKDEGLILVRRLQTKFFTLDYLRLVRGSTGHSEAHVASGSAGNNRSRGVGQNTGTIALDQQDHVEFWQEVETQVRALLSKEGRLVVNRLSGTIQVTDLHQRVREIEQFLTILRQSLYRQVEIEARIYEVTLKDDFSLGINWDKINFNGMAGTFVLSNIVTTPLGGFLSSSPTARARLDEGSFDVILEALEEQGDVKAVSQPRIVTLNNQPALIKVATDESFFTQTVSQGSAGTGNVITEQVRTITVGLVLSVTPQISEEGWVMLDVTPITSSLRETRTSPQGTATAPVLDIKQASTLVRVQNGATAVVAGLIQDTVSDTNRTVPILSDIPGLGHLFTGTFQTTRKSELVIFITPKIIEAE